MTVTLSCKAVKKINFLLWNLKYNYKNCIHITKMLFECVHFIGLSVSEDGVFKFGKDRLGKIPKDS